MALITNVAQAQAAGAYDAANGAGSYKALPSSPAAVPAKSTTPASGTDRVNGVSVNPNVPNANGTPYSAPSTPAQQTTNPAVITAKPAIDNYYSQLNGYNNLSASVTAQSDSNTAAKTTTPPKSATPPQGWDAQTYANFKAANPTLEPDAEDTKRMQQAGNTGSVSADDLLKALNGNGASNTSVGGATSTSTTSSNPTIDANQAKIDANNAQLDQIFGQHITDINNLRNGIFPLSPSQQAIITGTQAALADALASQKIANANYVGGVTNAGIAAGRNRYAPEIEAGNIANAVNVGIQKISKLENDAAITLGKLQDSFEQQDFNQIDSAYKEMTDYLKQKNDTLVKMNDTITAAAKDARDFVAAQKKEAFAEKMESDKFTYQQKQDEFDNFIKSADLTLKQKQLAQDAYFKQKDLDLKKAQNALLAATDPNVMAWVQNIKNGDAKLSDITDPGLRNSVSDGLANGGATSEASAELINQTSEAIDTLLKTPGKSAAIGTNIPSPWSVFTDPMDSFLLKGLPGSKSAGYEAQLDRVKNLITLPNLKLLKGVGRITQAEFQTLSSAMTSLNKNLPESEYDKELDRIKGVFDQKKLEVNTTHNGITLPSEGGSNYNGIVLPN